MRTDSQQHPYRATPAAPTGRVPRSRIADRYPTRSSACVEPGGRVRWIDRPHSVVWSEGRDGAADGPLSAGELRGHEEKG